MSAMCAQILDVEDDLVRRFRAGDEGALDVLVDRFGARLKAYLRTMLGNADTAEELTQEVFVRAWQHREQLRDGRKLEAWLFTTARHLGLREAGRARYRMESTREPQVLAAMELADRGPGQSDGLQRLQGAALLHRALESLDPKRRELVGLRYFSELSLAEIGEVLGMPLGSVGTTLQRSLLALRGWFEREGLKAEDLLP